MASIVDLMLFHTMERNMYRRFLKMGVEAEAAKAVIALWLWMESIGHHDLVRQIAALKDDLLLAMVAEGQSCVCTLCPNIPQPTSSDDIPVTARLLKEPISLRFFHYNRDVAVQGISHFLCCICNVVLDHSHPHSPPESTRRRTLGGGGAAGTSHSIPCISPALNPLARPWAPRSEQSNLEDHRSMFLTFSRGYPLSKDELLRFFTSRWGDCVEALMIEKTPAGVDPMFGRIVFSSASVIPRILNGNATAQFVINGKHLRARMFIPRRRD